VEAFASLLGVVRCGVANGEEKDDDCFPFPLKVCCYYCFSLVSGAFISSSFISSWPAKPGYYNFRGESARFALVVFYIY
jgi:hypothetical protein